MLRPYKNIVLTGFRTSRNDSVLSISLPFTLYPIFKARQ